MKKLINITFCILVTFTLITFTSCSQKLGCYYSYHSIPASQTYDETDYMVKYSYPNQKEFYTIDELQNIDVSPIGEE